MQVQVADELAKLDVLADKQKPAAAALPERDSLTGSGIAAAAAIKADASQADSQENGGGRLRQWSGKLGSHINTLKNRVGPNADQVTSTLRGLFQRQGALEGTAPR